MRRLLLLTFAAVTVQVHAQALPNRMILEAGLVGGNKIACPGQFVGVSGRVAGPLSLYGMVENFRCDDFVGAANRVGGSVLVGRTRWFVRPALRAGMEYDGGQVTRTMGASLTFGRRYGARLIVHVGDEVGGSTIVLFQMGGYIAF